jgi:hypothetical protein
MIYRTQTIYIILETRIRASPQFHHQKNTEDGIDNYNRLILEQNEIYGSNICLIS